MNGYRGDVRYLGALGEGPLPLDRPHLADVFNLFNSQTPTDYDPDTQTTFPVTNPTSGSRSAPTWLSCKRRVSFESAFVMSSEHVE